MSIKSMEKVYVGLDVGTNSCGWAVTDENYKLIKKSGKSLHGVRLFNEASSAETRRIKRSARRRNDRKKWRIDVLQELFNNEISKVDESFFIRLNNSFYNYEDKIPLGFGKYTLFNDKLFTDKEYFKMFPTIFHLRQYLKTVEDKPDIRLVYLACHNIIKYRGNFLMEGKDLTFDESSGDYLFELIDNLNNQINNLFDEVESSQMIYKKDSLKDILFLLSTHKSSSKLYEGLNSILNPTNDKYNQYILKLVSGQKIQLKYLFKNEKYTDYEIDRISFSDNDFEEVVLPNLEQILDDEVDLIVTAKTIYDWIVLRQLLGSESEISSAMIHKYDKHKKDLKILKNHIKIHYDKNTYEKVFRSVKEKNNYANYVKTNQINGFKEYVKGCSYEDFSKFLRKIMSQFETKNAIDMKNPIKPDGLSQKDFDDYCYIYEELGKGEFLPKQKTNLNGILPYQLHLHELIQILNNMSQHYTFLNKADDNQLTIFDKIISLLKFRIPYYVGPLNDYHKDDPNSGFAWVHKKETGKVYPWNFNQKIDVSKSAEQFITRMTNKCTYMKGKDVLPKNSLIYSEFCVLNELNKLKINGTPISTNLKNRIFEKLFKKYKKVTRKSLISFLQSEGIVSKNHEVLITGIDEGDFKNSLSSYIDFNKIFGVVNYQNEEMIERIIFLITIFEKNNLAILKIKEEFNLNDDIIKQIKKLNYKGWGSLSKEFLHNDLYVDNDLGEPVTIMYLLRNENLNLQEALNDRRFNLIDKLHDLNSLESKNVLPSFEEIIEETYTSPGTKRALLQAFKVVEEIKKIIKKPIDKFFVEVTRHKGEKKRTSSRLDQIANLYKKAKIDKVLLAKMQEELNRSDIKDKLRSDKVFFYFLQLGRCAYTNKAIDLDSIFSNTYDIDHIIPRAFLKDDSINNRVLVFKDANSIKTNVYPIDPSIRSKMLGIWKNLKNNGLISSEKFNRLTRSNELTSDEIGQFINRQLVYTNQSVKALSEVLSIANPKSSIVYSKAGNVSDFRQKFNILKCRDINDFHHAEDAYLNIVVGNVYNTKFGYDARVYLPKNVDSIKRTNTDKLFEYDVKGAWISGGQSINIVKNMINRYDVLVSKMPMENKGQLYDETIYPKEKDLFPIKEKEPYFDTEKYGGFKSLKNAYFVLVKYIEKGKEIIKFEAIPILFANKIRNNETTLEKILKEYFGFGDFDILIDNIKFNSLIKVNNSFAYIAGKTGSSIILHNANQTYAKQDIKEYTRLLMKHREQIQKTESIDGYGDASYTISVSRNEHEEDKKITIEENKKYYQFILCQLEKDFYKGLSVSNYISKLSDGLSDFSKLNVREQAYSLTEMLKLIQCNASKSNLSKFLDKAQFLGTNLISQNITELDIKIIDQSVTGFYQRVRWSNNNAV